MGNGRIGMSCIVGEEDVRDVVFLHVMYDVLREIAAVHHMDLLKRMEQIGRRALP